MQTITRFLSIAIVFLSLSLISADDAVPENPTAKWWKGNLHTHSLWSDGDDFPEMIAEWYRTQEYNFLAFSDHNIMSDGLNWMSVATVESRGGGDVLNKYRSRFSGGWVETKGTQGDENYSVRLKSLAEFRALLEERGKFILIPAEEISDRSQGKPVHINATNLKDVIQPVGGATVREAIRNNLRVVQGNAKANGREVLLHVNHPNFGYAITAEDLAAVVQERFFEVYNGHPDVRHEGDDKHPSVERMWDIANTIRIGELRSSPLLGIAVDDSHNYHGKPGSHTGRGWVMVRSKYLTPEHLIRAMKTGDFYASSGVVLKDVQFRDGELAIDIDGAVGEAFTTVFIGTRRNYDRHSTPRVSDNAADRISRIYSSDVGAELARSTGLNPRYRLRGDELYVRAVVNSTAAHTDPSFSDQKQQAWTQPVLPD